MSTILSRPPVPRIKLSRVDKRASSICFALATAGEGLSADNVNAVTAQILDVLDDEDIALESVRSTLLQYAGVALTPRTMNIISRQIAACCDRLCSGPLPVFAGLVANEWVAFEVVSAAPSAWMGDELGHTLQLYALTGYVAGSLFSKKFPDRWLAGLAYKIGYSRRLRYNYDATWLVGLRCWGYIQHSEHDSCQPDFLDIRSDAQTKKSNQDIIRKRLRFDVPALATKECCPNNYEHYCAECHATASECPGSFVRSAHVSG